MPRQTKRPHRYGRSRAGVSIDQLIPGFRSRCSGPFACPGQQEYLLCRKGSECALQAYSDLARTCSCRSTMCSRFYNNSATARRRGTWAETVSVYGSRTQPLPSRKHRQSLPAPHMVCPSVPRMPSDSRKGIKIVLGCRCILTGFSINTPVLSRL